MDAKTAHLLSLLSEPRSEESQRRLVEAIPEQQSKEIARALIQLVNDQPAEGPSDIVHAARRLYQSTQLRRE